MPNWRVEQHTVLMYEQERAIFLVQCGIKKKVDGEKSLTAIEGFT